MNEPGDGTSRISLCVFLAFLLYIVRYFSLFDDSKMNIWLCWLGEMS